MLSVSMWTIIITFMLGLLDSISLPFVYLAHSHKNYMYMLVSFIVSMLQLFLFSIGLNFSNLTLMNISWDLMSDIIVTLYGIFYLKDIDIFVLTKTNISKLVGLFMSFISLILMHF